MKMWLALLLVVKFLVIQSQCVVFMKYVLTLSKLQSCLRWSFVAYSKKVQKQFLIIIPVINIVASWCSVGQTDIVFIPHSFFYVFLLDLLNSFRKTDHFQRSASTKHWDLPLGSRSVCLSVVRSTESHKSILLWRQGASSQKLGSKIHCSPTARAIQLLYMTDLCSDVQLLSREFHEQADSMNGRQCVGQFGAVEVSLYKLFSDVP